jgi:NAD(P)-dependent dehydrogenase (short-subunit alcohol dehydrogenase family)
VSQQRSEKVALITGANKGIGFETNFFGAFAVTKAFLPLIQQAVSSMCPPGLAH